MDASKINAVLERFRKDYGIALTEAQAQDYLNFKAKKDYELGDNEAASVAGGANPDDDFAVVEKVKIPWRCSGITSGVATHIWVPVESDPAYKKCCNCNIIVGTDWVIEYT
ncbi:MAG: hypothetical protein IK118_01470 [Clostridia bacterium]|nr:hypothetical protein [Clostridia bacterium]